MPYHAHLASLLLLSIECEEVRDLLFKTLSLPLQARHFLSHEHHLSGELLLELLDVGCSVLSLASACNRERNCARTLHVDCGRFLHRFDESQPLPPYLVGQFCYR